MCRWLALLAGVWMTAAIAGEWQPLASDSAQLPQLRVDLTQPYRAEFVQLRSLKVLKRPLRSEGDLLLTGTGLIWHQRQPIAQTMIVSGDSITQLDATGETVALPQTAQEMVRLWAPMMGALLEGRWSQLADDFSFERYLDDAEQGVWQLRLTPTQASATAVLSQILLAGDADLASLTMLQQNGDSITIELTPRPFSPLSAREKGWLNDEANR